MNDELLSKYIGIPFKLGGNDFNGIDCIHIASKFLSEQGYLVEVYPLCTEEWLKNTPYDKWLELVKSYGEPIKIEDIQENDILYFAWKNEIHAGIYIGYGKYLHITDKSSSHLSRLNESAKSRIVAIMRPSKTEKKTLPPAGKTFVQGVATVVGWFVGGTIGFFLGGFWGAWQGAIIGASIGYSLFDPGPGEEGDASGSMSPAYKFGGPRLMRSNEIPVALIYGTVRVSGNIIYSKLSDDERTCYQLIGICEGEVNSITDIRIAGEDIAEFEGSSNTVYYGTATQVVDTRATDCYGLRYLAYVAHTWYAYEKLPNLPSKVTYLIEGLKVNTWNGSIWSSSKVYSNNPAACIRDYLMRDKEIGGCALPSTNIDNDAFGEVYDYCNGSVSDGEGGAENRYELNYCIDTKRAALDNLNTILSSFGGYMIVTGTTVKICVKKPATSIYSFTVSSIKAGSFKYSYMPKDNQLNRVGIQYVDINQEDTRPVIYVDDFTDQDERGIFEKIFPMFGIGRASQAARLAWQILYDLKINPIICYFETDLQAIHIEPGDIIKVSHDVTGWVEKPFMAIGIEEKEDNEYGIEAVAFNSSVYNDAYGSGIMTYDYGNAPDLYGAPPDVTGFEVTSDGMNLIFDWIQVNNKIDIKIKAYEIREGLDWNFGTLINAISSDQSNYKTPIRISGVRYFMIKAKSEYGRYSVNPDTDSITITRVEGANIILSEYIWNYIDNGTPSDDCQLIWTPNYNPAYYRRAIGVKTATTWEDHELAGRTWDQLEAYDWDTPVVLTAETFETPEIDLGIIYSGVPTNILAEYSGTETDVVIEWKYSETTPIGGAYTTFAPGEYSYRYVQFKITITCADEDVPSYLNDLILHIDAFDVTDRGKDVVVTAPGGATITFENAFAATPAIVVSTQGATPYTAIVTAKSATEFTVKLYDSNDDEQSGVIDWVARGWINIL